MSWTLVKKGSGAEESSSHHLAANQRTFLTLSGDSLDLRGNRGSHETDVQVLGCIMTGAWGPKLQALEDGLSVLPGHSRSGALNGPRVEPYELTKTDGYYETIILRESDTIQTTKTSITLTLVWTPPEIQVSSSAKGEVEAPGGSGVKENTSKTEDTVEAEDTEDEYPNDMAIAVTATQSNQLSRSTPIPSVSRSIVIQETPTADRVILDQTIPIASPRKEASSAADSPHTDGNQAPEASTLPAMSTGSIADSLPISTEESAKESKNLQESSKPDGPVDDNAVDVPMADCPEDPPAITPLLRKSDRFAAIDIPSRSAKKRPSPSAHDKNVNDSLSSRQTKRRKVDASDQESEEETIASLEPAGKRTPTPTGKRTKKTSGSQDLTQSTPSRSLRGSQASIAEDGLYTGPKPRVLFSNSAIPSNGSTIKFLRRHGGNSVDSVKDDCNILCVKEGPLVKTMKLLQSIALGIHIVTDKWLLESAKASRFLALEPYMPRSITQERDWNFSIQNIWGKKQNTLFQGHTIYFTPTLKATYKDFAEMEEVCKAVGARRVISRAAGGKEVDAEDTIRMASEKGDEDAEKLMKDGHTCFTKDLLTNSILRGGLNLETGEFRIQTPSAKMPTKKKGRPRKS